jgi:RNA-directed DNA polymerase
VGLYAHVAQRRYLLYDKIYREDILAHAYARARANHGAPGVDGQSFEEIEPRGLEAWLTGIRQELRKQTYAPQPVRRKMMEKPAGGERPLGIPTIRDRVVQAATKIVLEPIFEADLLQHFRNRGIDDTVRRSRVRPQAHTVRDRRRGA